MEMPSNNISAAASFSSAWLARIPVSDDTLRKAWTRRVRTLSAPVAPAGTPLASAVGELKKGIKELLGVSVRQTPGLAGQGLCLEVLGGGVPGSFSIRSYPEGVRITAPDGAGLLYGVFRLLEAIALQTDPADYCVDEVPHRAIRMLDHWDNLDGSVERGYAGRSLFFSQGKILPVGPRLKAYARLLASIGINATVLNNVNVHGPETELITPKHLPRLAQIAQVFRAWGIQLYLSANFASPLTLGDLETSDPLDPRVIRWWTDRAEMVWSALPDFGGFVVKADSEGRPGPFTYGRDHADGANLLARAVAPYGGTIFWRCFVYNCLQDWRDRTTDRARAAYDHFQPLDGRFEPNVCLQIKNGPMDFQPREPVSPLFGALKKTRMVLEVQAAQEYTGQQRHVCFLPEQWRTYLETVIDPAGGRSLAEVYEGICAVTNLGDDPNWTGHDLAQANWYGFGRLAWNPLVSPQDVAQQWAGLTFGTDPTVVATVTGILLGSWKAYEDYSAPLGVGWLVNPNHHYGPNPDGYEYDRWGTYHFADRDGVGVDRTSTGSNYARQYQSTLASLYENLATCPDELLLFFHHVPYGHRLKSGLTVIQHIYDTHFAGAERAAQMGELWKSLEGKVPDGVFSAVADRLAHQKDHAALWRDIVNTYFYRKSGVGDRQGRLIHR